MCELPEVCQHDTPVARKDHACISCHGKIPAGEQYHRYHGVWDGRGAAFKICCDCEALRAEVDRDIHDPEAVTPFEELCDYVFNADEPKWIKRFLDTKRKRGATIQAWMLARETVVK